MGRRLERAVCGLLVFGGLSAWACDDAASTGGPVGIEHAMLLQSLSDNVVGPAFAEFATAAASLEAATSAYVTGLESADPATPELREAAQDAWRVAMFAWQQTEPMQLGPAGRSGVAIGGADLRDEIYSWPTVNPCRVDEETVDASYEAADFTATRLVNAYGLDALEYLLFTEDPGNACAPQLPINMGPWDALGDAEVEVRRARYATAIARDLVAQAGVLAATWSPGQGEFAVSLAAPGEPSSHYESIGQALDEVMRGMFYLDLVTKDEKLGRPAGINDCSTEVCIDDLESTWADHSKEDVLANLQGFRRVYLGGETPEIGAGFDDVLIAAGQDDLAARMLRSIDSAIASIEAIDGSFREALSRNPAALDGAHTAVKTVTDLLKGEFATVLTLTIPTEGAGDAD